MRNRKVLILVLAGTILMQQMYGVTAEEGGKVILYEEGETKDYWEETEESTEDIFEESFATEADEELWEEESDEGSDEGSDEERDIEETEFVTELEEPETEVEVEREEVEEETESEKEEAETEEETERSTDGWNDVDITGIPVIFATGWQKADTFSEDYRSLRFYPDISYLEVFCESDQVELMQEGEGMTYLHPMAKGQEGLFGGIYHNVLYNEGRWYDLRMSVAAYSLIGREDSVEEECGFGSLGFAHSDLGISWNEGMGELVLCCEICDAVTGEVMPKNFRFQWSGIGYGQRYGIRAIDGKVSGRYYKQDSNLLIQADQTVSGIEQIEIVQGSTEEERSVCYEMANCSSYYLAMGFCGHGKREDLLWQTGVMPGKIMDSSPDIQESKNRTEYYTDMELTEGNLNYWYRIFWYVPLQPVQYYYSDYQIKDVIPEGVKCLGNISIIREEDGRDVSEQFIISSEEQMVIATAKRETLSREDFYGYHYRMEFFCRLIKDALLPELADQKAKYVVENHPVINCRTSTDDPFTSLSGMPVRTILTEQFEKPDFPKLSLEPDCFSAEKILQSREEEIVMTVCQKIPEYSNAFTPDSIMMQYYPEECIKIEKAELFGKKKQSEVFEEIDADVNSLEEIQAKWRYENDYAGGELCMKIYGRISPGEKMVPYQTETGKGYRIIIQNEASVTFNWMNEKIEPLRQNTNTGTLLYIEKLISLTVQIDGRDVVWEHGQPTFLLHIEGKDMNGNPQEFHRAIVFTPEMTAQETMQKRVDIMVPPGEYEVYSQDVIRYRIREISDIENGEQKGEGVFFHLKENGAGNVVLIYEKTTDEGNSDTCFVNNIIG